MMNYEEAVKYLYAIGHETLAMKLGLEGISLLCRDLGEPQRDFVAAHIAGTNGKGSTAAMMEAIAREAGLRIGLYTSPHLVEITERIRVDGQPIPPEDFARLATKVRASCEQLVASRELPVLPTFFEQVTAIAFLYFAERQVELAVLEVGLGGRLDATNICQPLVTAITPVALDHQRYLGDTLAAIAREKAGIIKATVPVVIAPQEAEAMAVITERCTQMRAPRILVADDSTALEIVSREDNQTAHLPKLLRAGLYRFRYRTGRALYDVQLNLRGRHQVTNACTAIHIAEQLGERGLTISRQAIIEGLRRVEWPGRLEMVTNQGPLLLDGAHNPAGARALRDFLKEHYRMPITLIFGSMADKAIAEIAAILFPVARTVVITSIADARAASSAAIAAQVGGIGYQLICASNAAQALTVARRFTPPEGLICACGSLYLIGELKKTIGTTLELDI